MSDLEHRLSALRTQTAPPVDDATVAADLQRGRSAVKSRRRNRAAIGIAAVAIVGCAGLSFAATSNSGSTGSSHSPAIKLVDYTGKQLKGYTIDKVPDGYVLQGVSEATLDVAKAGDHSDLSTFVDKLVVTLDDHVNTVGKSITVGNHPGRIHTSDGTTILTFEDGKGHHVNVQQWNTIKLTQQQLIDFADGITVQPGAQVSVG